MNSETRRTTAEKSIDSADSDDRPPFNAKASHRRASEIPADPRLSTVLRLGSRLVAVGLLAASGWLAYSARSQPTSIPSALVRIVDDLAVDEGAHRADLQPDERADLPTSILPDSRPSTLPHSVTARDLLSVSGRSVSSDPPTSAGPNRLPTSGAPPIRRAESTADTSSSLTLPISTTLTAPADTSTASSAVTTEAAPASSSSPTTSTTSSTPGSPLARGDNVELERNKNKNIKVLDNDSPGLAPLDEATLEIVVEPGHAQESYVHNDHLHYRSTDDFTGTDTLAYRICDTSGLCATATVTITVTD